MDALLEKYSSKSTPSCEVTEQRTVIKFCVAAGKSPLDTINFLNAAGDGVHVARATVYKWYRRFQDGRLLFIGKTNNYFTCL